MFSLLKLKFSLNKKTVGTGEITTTHHFSRKTPQFYFGFAVEKHFRKVKLDGVK